LTNEPGYLRRGNALVTTLGEVVSRPSILPQDRYLVSASDGIHYQAYVLAGFFWHITHGKKWRCISGERAWLNEYDAWKWIENGWCVNRAFAATDWHGVGYARWMQEQHWVSMGHKFPYRWGSFTTEPPWVYTLYRHGPPDWNSPSA
jgi:hypothetical protein